MANRPGAVDGLERGREAYRRRAWRDAHRWLSEADEGTALAADDIELLALSAYMIGRDGEWRSGLERAHRAHLEQDEPLPAARDAFWLGFYLASRGKIGPASGWLQRSQRLVAEAGADCVERGYLLLPTVLRLRTSGKYDAAHDAAAEAVLVGRRFGEPDLCAWAQHEQGRALMRLGRVAEGLALLDEAMVAVAAGECSPLATGQIYCSVIDACAEVHELRRAHEWTTALTEWCEAQPGLVTTYAGQCLVHRAEILQVHGGWADALAEARRATELLSRAGHHPEAATALYAQAEIHRLLGAFTDAEEAYRGASRLGLQPQPGLALLRAAQGKSDAAAATMRRVLDETTDRLQRARLLPAYVEIMVRTGDIQQARDVGRELEEAAEVYATDVLAARAAYARGLVELADGDARTALGWTRRAGQIWQELDAPYDAALAREQAGLACRALGDDDGASVELDAARAAFTELGAGPDLARIDALQRRTATRGGHGLTRRELEVLRLVAGGATNRVIAERLRLSEKTVDRHVSNILGKLAVSSRTAATAYAYEHELL